MTGDVTTLAGVPVFMCPEAGSPLSSEADALDLVGAGSGTGVDWVVIPVNRLNEDFFDLSTGLAGAFLQKLLNYQQRVAIVGDIGQFLARSGALRDFVRECNRGTQIRFADDLEALAEYFRNATRG